MYETMTRIGLKVVFGQVTIPPKINWWIGEYFLSLLFWTSRPYLRFWSFVLSPIYALLSFSVSQNSQNKSQLRTTV